MSSLMHARRWAAGLVAGLLVALAAGAAPALAAPGYVSLGDSYTAGPLIPKPLPPYGCLKSDHNYPHLAAPQLGLPLRDRAAAAPRPGT